MKQSEAVLSRIGGCEAGRGGKDSGKMVARDVQAKCCILSMSALCGAAWRGESRRSADMEEERRGVDMTTQDLTLAVLVDDGARVPVQKNWALGTE